MRLDDRSRTKIVVVDDDADGRTHHSRILKDDYAVAGFATATSALGYCASNQVSAVLYSPNLSDMPAAEFMSRLIAMNPLVPAIILATEEVDLDLSEILETGAFDYLIPPFPKKYLIYKVKQALQYAATQGVSSLLSAYLRRTQRYTQAFLHDLASPLATILNASEQLGIEEPTARSSSGSSTSILMACGTNCLHLTTIYRHCLTSDTAGLPHEYFNLPLLIRRAYSSNSELAMSKGIRVQMTPGNQQVRVAGPPASLMEVFDYLIRVALMLCLEGSNRVRIHCEATSQEVVVEIENESDTSDASERIETARAAASNGLTDFADCQEIIRVRWGGSIEVTAADGKICHEIRFLPTAHN